MSDASEVLCALNAHDWSEPQYESDDSCLIVEFCKRGCGAIIEVEEKHEWNEAQYESDKSCLQTRTCERCKEEEEGEVHEWCDPEYESENSCQLVEICKRCGDVQETGEMHDWSDWEYASEDECVRHCYRCNEDEFQDHEWNNGICECCNTSLDEIES